ERDPRLVSRIPIRPAPGADPTSVECGPNVFPTLRTAPNDVFSPGYFIDHFDTRVPPKLSNDMMTMGAKAAPFSVPVDAMHTADVAQEGPQLLDWMNEWMPKIDRPNACIYLGGPVIGDPASAPDPLTAPPDPRFRPGRPQHVRARFRNTQVGFLIAN